MPKDRAPADHLVSEPGAPGRRLLEGEPGDHAGDVEETGVDVPAERDELGRVRTVTATTPEAASHWDERLWNRA